MDLKTGDFTGGAPEDTLMGAAVGDVGASTGCRRSAASTRRAPSCPRWQSAVDDVTTTLLSMLTGVDMLTGVGMVAGGRIFSYVEMALAAETITRARRLAAGLDLSALGGSAASSSCKGSAVGPTPPAGPTPSGTDPVGRARERMRAILAVHHPPALPAHVDAQLRKLAQIH